MDNTSQQKQQTATIPAEVRTFLEGMLTDANMITLDDQMREEMVKELFARLDAFITTKIVEHLPEDQLEVFMKMADDGKPKEEIEAFLKQHLPNAQDVFADAFGEFRQIYLHNVSVSRQKDSLSKGDTS